MNFIDDNDFVVSDDDAKEEDVALGSSSCSVHSQDEAVDEEEEWEEEDEGLEEVEEELEADEEELDDEDSDKEAVTGLGVKCSDGSDRAAVAAPVMIPKAEKWTATTATTDFPSVFGRPPVTNAAASPAQSSPAPPPSSLPVLSPPLATAAVTTGGEQYESFLPVAGTARERVSHRFLDFPGRATVGLEKRQRRVSPIEEMVAARVVRRRFELFLPSTRSS